MSPDPSSAVLTPVHARIVWIWCIAILGLPHLLGAADYYVSPAGADTNAGTVAAPLRTITKAYSRVVAGDRILVQPGTYTDYQPGKALLLDKNGSAGAPITLKSVQPRLAIIDGSGQTDRWYGVTFSGNHNVLDGFTVTGSRFTAVFVSSANNQIINNEITNNGKVLGVGTESHTGNAGIYEGSSSGETGNYFGQNYIHDNGGAYYGYDHGLYLCGDNGTVVNNIVVRHTHGMGLQIAGYNTVSGLKVFHNVFGWNGRRGIVLWLALANIQIANNIVVWNGTDGIGSVEATGSGVTVSDNVVFGNATNIHLSGFAYTTANTIQKDPLFVSTTDYHLQSPSPAIDAGQTLASVTQDFAGNPRPSGTKPDIGAYEFREGPKEAGL